MPPELSWGVINTQGNYRGKPWNPDKLNKLAELIRVIAGGTDVKESEIFTAIEQFNRADGDLNDYADAIELGNQIVAESPYPYQLGSIFLKDYDGKEGFRRGGFYATANQERPIDSKPDEKLLKFRTPRAGEKGLLQKVSEGEEPGTKEFVGEGLNQYKWNPWLYPHSPESPPSSERSMQETHNILKTLEYGYKDLPKGDDFINRSPHLVIMYTGHE